MRRRIVLLVAATVIVALLGASCTADSKIDAVADVGAPEPAPTATPDPNDPSLAERLLLDDSVLGAGWTAEPRSEDSDPEQDAKFRAIAEATAPCDAAVQAGFIEDGPQLVDDAPTKLESPTWTRGSDEVEFTVSIFQTVDDAVEPFRKLEELSILDCYRELLPAIFAAALDTPDGPEVTLGDVGFTTPPVTGADDVFRLIVDITVTVVPTGEEVALNMELAAIRSGRVVSALNVFQLGSSVDGNAIIAAIQARLDEVLGS